MSDRAHALTFTASVVLAVAALVPSAPRNAHGSAGPIDAALASAVERNDVPAVVAMASDRHRILYQAAFGLADFGSHRRLRADAIFRIASMTKPITTVAAMQLVEERRIGLDDPAERYLPELADVRVIESFDQRTGAYTLRPPKTAVTIRQLLTHTSGFGYAFTSPTVRDFKPRNDDRVTVGPLMFDPGERWLYGTGIDWVGRIVESVSGHTLEDYFRERIFRPLRMPDTSFNVPDASAARLVTVQDRRPDGTFVEERQEAPRRVTRFNGGGGLFSTAADYTRFLQMILNDGELDGARVLRADTVAEMGRNQIGAVSARALKTAMPELSRDFTFIADGRDKWGLGFLITADGVPGRRSAGSLSWGGIDNTYFWVDRRRGVAGVILMQFLPFADPRALEVSDAFERDVYALAQAQ